MTRSKSFAEAEDDESVVHKKEASENKGTDGKKNDVRGESNQETKKQKQKQLQRMETEARNDGRVCFGQLLDGVPVLFGNSINGEVNDAGGFGRRLY